MRERLVETAYASALTVDVLPEGVDAGARARARHGRRRARRVRRPRDRDRRSSSARSTTSARAQQVRPSRTRTSRSASTRRPASGCRASSYERHGRPADSSPAASTPASGARPRTSPSSARPGPPSARRCSAATGCRRPALLVSREHLGVRRAAGGRRQLRRRRTPPRASAASSTRSRRRRRRAGCSICQAEEVLVLSTGVIGVRLPLDKILPGLRIAVAELSADGGPAAAEAIMTTDTDPKEAAVTRDGFTVGGMAKGAGMIHPDLATMLGVPHHRLPARAGRGDRVPPPGRRRDLQRASRSTATARRTTRCCSSRTARAV